MKYFLIIISIAFCGFYSATACDSNWIVTGKNGYKFCISKYGYDMNWWTAFQWCQAQGYKLATPEQACNTDNGHNWEPSARNCQFMSAGIGEPWLNHYKDGQALRLKEGGGVTRYEPPTHSGHAICVMND